MKFYSLFLSVLFLFTSCANEDGKADTYLPEANGQHGEILLLLNNHMWEGEIGPAVIASLTTKAEGPYLRPEPMFSYFRKEPSDLNHLNQLNRNILKFMVATDSTYKETAVIIKNNYYAKNQLFVIVKDSDPKRLEDFARNKMGQIIDLFNDFELKQLTRMYSAEPNNGLKELVEGKFDVSIDFPKKTVLKTDRKDFILMKRDRSKNLLRNDASRAEGGTFWIQQGFMVWSEPYLADSNQLDVASILQSRDSILKKNVAGRVKGTYMATEYDPYYKPEAKEVSINGQKAVEIRGLWKHDGIVFTGGGGPFVQRTFVNKSKTKVVTFCGYIYAPKFDKREFIREVDAVLNTIEII